MNLSIHTAPDVRPLPHAASGFTSSTGSSCCQLASVDPWPRLNNAAPSVRPHYRAFLPTTDCSAPVPRIGTLALAGISRLDVSLHIGTTGSRVPQKSLIRIHAASKPDAARAGLQAPPALIPEATTIPLVSTSSSEFRHVISDSLALVSSDLT